MLQGAGTPGLQVLAMGSSVLWNAPKPHSHSESFMTAKSQTKQMSSAGRGQAHEHLFVAIPRVKMALLCSGILMVWY